MTQKPKWERNTAIIASVVAIASLLLNMAQFEASRRSVSFEQLKDLPQVSVVHLELSKAALNKMAQLRQEGKDFELIPNPGVLYLDSILRLPIDVTTLIKFRAIVNKGTVSLDSMELGSGAQAPPIRIGQLNAMSSLLIPAAGPSVNSVVQSNSGVTQLRYFFRLGGRPFVQNISIPVPRTPATFFEAGLGPIGLGAIDLDTQERRTSDASALSALRPPAQVLKGELR